MTDYEQGYIDALTDVEKAANRMAPVGNWMHNISPGRARNLHNRQRTARMTELGSQHLAILRITQGLRRRQAAVA